MTSRMQTGLLMLGCPNDAWVESSCCAGKERHRKGKSGEVLNGPGGQGEFARIEATGWRK